MKIKVNEKVAEVAEGLTLFDIKVRHKNDADIVIFNGCVVSEDYPLHDGDTVQLIKRGEVLEHEVMEGLLVARHTPGVHEVIKRATVGIAGLGGLGSACAAALCRMGIGKLIVVDFDVVEPSNLNRQHYFMEQIGMHKTEATKKNLAKINPFVTVDARCVKLDETNVPAIFKGASVIVEAFDRADMKAMLIKTVLTRMPEAVIVGASGVAGYGDGNTIKALKVAHRLFLIGDFKSEARPGMGLMAPRVGIAAHQQANTVIRVLLGEES
jgi:sulfur carrier protein ThiS adenylyltransferase